MVGGNLDDDVLEPYVENEEINGANRSRLADEGRNFPNSTSKPNTVVSGQTSTLPTTAGSRTSTTSYCRQRDESTTI